MSGPEDALFDLGMRLRREVLGDTHVDRSWAAAEADPMIRSLQECVTRFGWGGAWGRPGLDRKSRSLATVSMLVALNRREELKLHLRGALNNGWTRGELCELLLHAGCYCGWPAAIDSFRAAKEVFDAESAQAPAGETAE